METRFSYYDFIANIVPAGFLLWSLYVFGIVPNLNLPDSEIVWGFLFLILVYVLWLIIQYVAKQLIENWILKGFFWKWFFSDRILDNSNDDFTKLVIEKSIKYLWFEEEQFNNLTKKTKEELSHKIYKIADNYTKDKGLATKWHTANHMYSLFRGLALSSIIIIIVQICHIIIYWRSPWEIIIIISFLLLTLLFVRRAKERGEYYIKNIFYSLQ